MGFALPELDEETLDELILSIQEALDVIEPSLDTLLHAPENPTVVNDLFRHLHTVKGNFRMCFLEPFTNYVHWVEECISEVRNGEMIFDSQLHEVTLLALDKLRFFMEELRLKGECDPEAMSEIAQGFQHVAEAHDRHDALNALSQLLGGKLSPQQQTKDNPDLAFFRATAAKLDQQRFGHSNYSRILIAVCKAIASELKEHIDNEQLEAAIYLHDIGMGLLENQKSPLSEQDKKRLYQHPTLAHQYLIKHPGWEQAADIALQHEEHVDGSGFPQGLMADDILLEAKILSVAEHFCSALEDNKHEPEKRAVLIALNALSKRSGAVLDGNCIQALTLAVRQHYSGA